MVSNCNLLAWCDTQMDFFKEKKNQTSTKLKTPHQSSYLSIFFKKNTVFIVNKIHIHILALNISLGIYGVSKSLNSFPYTSSLRSV